MNKSVSRFLYLRTSLSRLLIRNASSTESSTTKVPMTSKTGDVYDPNSEMLQTLDIEDLPRAQKRFAKQFEKVNEERIKEIFAKNFKNQIGLALLLVVVVGIYFYTIKAVKQETFLEEIDQEVAAERGEAPPTPKK